MNTLKSQVLTHLVPELFDKSGDLSVGEFVAASGVRIRPWDSNVLAWN